MRTEFAAPGMLIDLFNLGALEPRPPSLFNRQTQLRVVRRSGRLIAMHWDKRDDDLLPFGSPVEFWPNPFPPEPLLTCGTRRARVKLHFQRYVDEPPTIERCEFRWTGDRRARVGRLLPVGGTAGSRHLVADRDVGARSRAAGYGESLAGRRGARPPSRAPADRRVRVPRTFPRSGSIGEDGSKGEG
jgi:hypothetical protein